MTTNQAQRVKSSTPDSRALAELIVRSACLSPHDDRGRSSDPAHQRDVSDAVQNPRAPERESTAQRNSPRRSTLGNQR